MICAKANRSNSFPLLIVRKSKKSCSFKNLSLNTLPANYNAQKMPGRMKSMKRRYQRAYIQKLVLLEYCTGVKGFWKSNSIKHAICNIVDAWNNLPAPTIKYRWNKLWPELKPETEIELENAVQEDVDVKQFSFNIPGSEQLLVPVSSGI